MNLSGLKSNLQCGLEVSHRVDSTKLAMHGAIRFLLSKRTLKRKMKNNERTALSAPLPSGAWHRKGIDVLGAPDKTLWPRFVGTIWAIAASYLALVTSVQSDGRNFTRQHM